MMFAEPEHIEADPVGKLDLLQNVGEALVDIDRLAGRGIAPGLDEGVGAELHEGPRGTTRFARGTRDVRAGCDLMQIVIARNEATRRSTTSFAPSVHLDCCASLAMTIVFDPNAICSSIRQNSEACP